MEETTLAGVSLSNLVSVEWLTAIATNLAIALAILIITFWLANWLQRRITNVGQKYKDLDDTLFTFMGRIVRVVVIIFGATVILNRFGVQTTSIVALVGAAGLAIGLALQGTLSNFAAGVMLIVFRPFKKDDYISVSGQSGTVKGISIFTTELATTDNVQIIVPNGQIWGAPITNYSVYPTRRLDFVFGVSYGSDLKKAEKLLIDMMSGDERIHKDPEPFVKVGNLNNSSVDFTVRVWCDAGDYWPIKFDMTRAVKDAFDKNGIDIPFPTTTIVQA